MVDDPMRTPPGARSAAAGTGVGVSSGMPAPGLPVLDAKGEKVRQQAQLLLAEPVLTMLIGRGRPPRKWPALVAILLASMGAALTPVSGAGPLVFWGTAIASGVLWRQYQEGRFPPAAEPLAGVLAVTPTRLATLSVRRGWFESSLDAQGVLAVEPLRPLMMHNRIGWGRIDVDGSSVHIDKSDRKKQVSAINYVVAALLEGTMPVVPFLPHPTMTAPPPPEPSTSPAVPSTALPPPPAPPPAPRPIAPTGPHTDPFSGRAGPSPMT